ncbi:hypothetical protein PFICI_11746 [Pestalotiopsis fici W106-1]|uniref:Heterokaryon incompatibility domain-containing protein n=1 Tax=Pestalotiopsis fici (strain W106-1 / CGMCC3.15140) TaxID=1229662 RepID=W3WR93_PESFW|nr:uncharacterized protein PFICI_11746 [Pestalotiopsis fici W106-1]ETS76359.1 hypothetical protein PFICI_11746 [Pestalotiopsis fici W106-1]
MSTSCFEYPSLDKTKSQIRLLEILPQADHSLQCSLTTFHTSACPRYIALSYVWGDDEPTNTIVINGQPFEIRNNLSHALPRLADLQAQRDEKHFWIDAICINQKDTGERNHQVGMMNDIFTQASLTASWLGLGQETSELLPSAQTTWPEPGTSAFLAKIDCNTYFQRMWIVQEVMLSRDIWVLCDNVICPWEKLAEFWLVSSRTKCDLNRSRLAAASIASKGVAADLSLASLSSAIFWRGFFHANKEFRGELRLEQLLNSFLDRECHDPRDRIYSLLGLLPRETLQSNPLPVDYDISLEDLFSLVLQHLDQSSAGVNSKWPPGFGDVEFSRDYNARNLRMALNLES